MKKMKKLFALLMTLAMVMGLGITAMAAENTNTSIKVNNTGDAEIRYIQIVEPDTSSTNGWKLVDRYADTITNAGVTLQDILDAASTSGEDGTINTSEKLGTALEALRGTVMSQDTISGDTITNITSAGAYLIIPSQTGWTYAPTLAYVPVDSTTQIDAYVKGEPDQIGKTTQSTSVGKDGVIQYTITANYPYISPNYKNPSFTIVDTITNGEIELSEEYPFTATVTNGELSYSGTPSDGDTGFTISINNYQTSLAGETITLTYYVKYTGNNSADLINNVESNLQIIPNGVKTTTKSRVITHPSQVTILKREAGENGKVLADAEFAIYEYNGTEDDLVTTGKTPVYSGKTDASGSLTFYNLDASKQYFIVETAAPAGYVIDTTPRELTDAVTQKLPDRVIEENGEKITVSETIVTKDFNSGSITVTNTTAPALPETGGMGTTLFTIAGCVIMISAAGLFFASRKRAN